MHVYIYFGIQYITNDEEEGMELKLRFNLVTQIFVAFVLAIILGSIFGSKIDFLQPLGDLFLRLIKFVIAPLILSTLVVGVASMSDPKQLGRIGIKTIVYYLATTAIAIIIGLSVAFLINPGTGVNISTDESSIPEAAIAEPQSAIDTFLNIVPTNPFEALATGNILQIIFFALFIGIAITMIGEKSSG